MNTSTLFDPVRIGAWDLPNRIVMAPLTRARAGTERIPNALMAEYYTQRATAGLIISEATSVTPIGVGYADTPGIWSSAQVDGWKHITQSVHKAGGRMLLQLWHVGRISDPIFLNGALPVAPSAIPAAGHVSLVRPEKPFVTPRALELEEISGVVETFRKGAENAQRAGFDGVEIHGANGYLLDQFLQDKTNHRTDTYGGFPSGAQTVSGCIWRRAAMPTIWAIPTRWPRLDMWPVKWAAVASLLFAPVNRLGQTASGRN
jgi:NADPH2 dehydrogenase